MNLKGRLKLIANKVPKADIICDIGTDHGYIPIFLVEKGICKKAVAADIGIGPVKAAQENIRQAGFEKSIDARLGNGLEPVGEGEAEVIVIAGMGGVLIIEILAAGMEKAKGANALILQPMTGIEELREWLYFNGFEIYDEELCAEGEKIYDVISAKWAGISEVPDKVFFHVGRKLIEKKDPLLNKYINRKTGQMNKAINGLEKSSSTDKEELKDLYGLREKLTGLLQDL